MATTEQIQEVRFKLADPYKQAIDNGQADGVSADVELSRHPVQNVVAYLDDTPTTEFSLDNGTGVLTFNETPTQGTSISIHYEYAVFSDEEIGNYYDKTNSIPQTVVSLIEVLLVDSARRFDYVSGDSNVKASQVFDNLYRLLEYWKGKVREENASDNNAGGARLVDRKSKFLRDKPERVNKDLSRLL